MFDYDHFMTLADGEEKMQYLKTCITDADNAADFEEALDMRYLYIRESIFNEDSYKGIIMFPEYMALFDKHPDKHEVRSFMIAFKWIIENVLSFYQISSEMIENYFEEFKKRCEMYGYSLRTYYMKKMLFYNDADPEKARSLHEPFRSAERDDLSDCHACEISHDISMEFRYGSAEKAVAMLNDMLEQGISCAEVPHVTYGSCVEHFTKTGMLSEADHYADILLPMIRDNGNFLMELAHILCLKTITDPDKAFEIFTRHLKLFAVCRNPKMRFYFANAASRLLRSAPIEDDVVINLQFPRCFELYNDKNEYTFTVLKKYFYETASDIAAKLDNRNGTSAYTDRLNFVYPDKPVKELKLPAHSTAPITPYSLAVPFRSEDGYPTADDMKKALSSIEGYVLTDLYVDDNTNELIADMADPETNSTICLAFFRAELPEDCLGFRPIHAFSDDDHINLSTNFKNIIVMRASFGVNSDRTLMLFLKTADRLNADNSPVILDMMNMRMLSAKWVSFNAENNIVPTEDIYWNIQFCSALDGNGYAAFTSGLPTFGSKNLFVNNVTEENLSCVCRILEQAANKITGVSLMCDENVEMPFGVWYNNESVVYLSWMRPSLAYPNSPVEESMDKIFAVPFISLHTNGENKKILLNDITEDIAEKLCIRNSFSYSTKKYAASKLSFETALNVMNDGDILTVGFTAEYGEEETADVFGNVIKGSSPVSCIIESDENAPSELSQGTEIPVVTDEIFFWRLTCGEEEYDSETAYLLT